MTSALLAAPATTRAQEPAPSLQINQVDGSGYPAIRAVVSALDADGVPIAGLPAAAFTPLEGETPIALTGFAPASDPDQRLGVALVIDVSASMQGAPLEAAKLAAIAFVQGLGPGDEAAVFAYNDAVRTVVPFTLDRGALTYGIAGLSAGGGSALYEAARTGLYAAGAIPTERKAVILLNGSANTAARGSDEQERVFDVAQDAAAPVYSMSLGSAADDAFLSQLAALTMGQHRAVPASDAGRALRDIATVLQGQYVLTMTGAGTRDGQRGELRVIADLEGSPAGAIAGFRRGPAPITASPSAGDGGASVLAWIGLVALIAMAVMGVIAGAAFLATRIVRDIRTARHQREVVAPNQQRAAAQPLPRPVGPLRTAPAVSTSGLGATVAADAGPPGDRTARIPAPASQAAVEMSAMPDRPAAPIPAPVAPPVVAASTQTSTSAGARSAGKFVEKTSYGRGQTFELGAGPIVIGSSPRECTIVLPASADVAPAHVRIWLRDGKYVMHHAGGFRRRTLIGGQPTDWCVLEHGDELQIGPHKLVYVEEGNERPLRF